MITRRAAISGLACLAACARRPSLEPLPESLRLGWRWVPGQRLTYETRTTHRRPGQETQRVERWTYLVTRREGGIATVEGHLIAVGGRAEGSDSGIEAALQTEREKGSRTRFRVGTDGRVRPGASEGCERLGEPASACFGRQLPHRMLLLPLPAEPVQPGRSWSDEQASRSLASLLGSRARLAEHQGTCSLFDLYRDAEGAVRAELRHTLLARTEQGLVLRADGRSVWDPVRGALAERSWSARVSGAPGVELHAWVARVA